tara:strand:+ start:1493 stop:3340 length:1848 start_codon:yes stop_codon:yes gene_type:complete
MARNIKKEVKKHKEVAYLQKDFQSFRSQLESFSRQHYGDKIVDMSEGSLAGMMIDIAAYVGDSMSFYMDHQFNELTLETAVEESNIESHIRQTGIEISGPSPSIVELLVRIKVPAKLVNSNYVPDPIYIPQILNETIFGSQSGVSFTLLDTIDFSRKNELGDYVADVAILSTNSANEVTELTMTAIGVCTSAKTHVQKISLASDFVPFRKIDLEKTNVIEIISVIDSSEDNYHEVESLTQDTVYERMENTRQDVELVQQRIRVIPAPKRFVKFRSRTTGVTTLRFGAGNETKFDEDIIPDPSDHAIKLYGDRTTFSKISIDPNALLETNTLGISPSSTVLTITYRYGGGLDNNVPTGQIQAVNKLITKFNSSVPSSQISEIRSTLSVTNLLPAAGGENEPSLDELRTTAIFAKTSQGRVVTREDLIARVYSMPSNFGRVFRVSVRDNPSNPLSAQLHIISRDSLGKLILSPDVLKENLSLYLSQYRLISDAVDVLDAQVINIALKYAVNIDTMSNPEVVIQSINSSLKSYFKIENFQIDQPIMSGDVENIILNTRGVLSIGSIRFLNRTGTFENRQYSFESYSPARNLDRGMLFPPRGGIFEFRHLNDDIIGRVN